VQVLGTSGGNPRANGFLSKDQLKKDRE
jgi:Zn/Cd-binding protein ZinT